jgi:ribonuclease P protein component
MRQTFTKDERLHKKILIDRLFREGSSFHVHPYRVTWFVSESKGNFPAQILISVPKHSIRNAVDRNTIKRRTREAYRKNKFILYDFLGNDRCMVVFGVTYTSKDMQNYQLLQEKIIVLLQRLIKEYAKTAG